MNKLNVGDYVRTKDGDIFKYIKTDENGKLRRTLKSDNGNVSTAFELKNVLKFKPRIIDLIEVGDYVNGKKVIDTYTDYIFDYSEEFKVIRFSETDILQNSKNIKSIVTKEQFENISYKVGE